MNSEAFRCNDSNREGRRLSRLFSALHGSVTIVWQCVQGARRSVVESMNLYIFDDLMVVLGDIPQAWRAIARFDPLSARLS